MEKVAETDTIQEITETIFGKLDFVDPKHPILTQKAFEVTPEMLMSDGIQYLISKMLEFASGKRADGSAGPRLVGLSAVQLGFPLDIFVAFVPKEENPEEREFQVFVNTKITRQSKETELSYEGCLTMGDICGVISRPKTIKIEALNENGQAIVRTFTGIPARIILHEKGHSDGLQLDSFTDILCIVPESMFPLFREQFEDRELFPIMSVDEFKEIKGYPPKLTPPLSPALPK